MLLNVCGTAWTKTNEFQQCVYYGIYLNAGTGTSSNIQNNTIRNIDWSNSTNGSWTGIQIARGDVNIGTVTGNTIGAATGTGSIMVTGSTLTETQMCMEYNIASPGNVDCRNNQIGSITVANADANGCNFYGIYKSNSAGNTTISNNTIGSPDEANSILASSPSTGFAQTVRGIYNAGTGTIIISDNTIANLTNGTTNTTVGYYRQNKRDIFIERNRNTYHFRQYYTRSDNQQCKLLRLTLMLLYAVLLLTAHVLKTLPAIQFIIYPIHMLLLPAI